MANNALPIRFTESLQLTTAGIQQAAIGFNSCTLESDNFVCIRQKASEEAQPEVIIINLKNHGDIMRRPIKADSAIMHWHRQVIALKAAQRTLQIFDLGAKSKIKSYTMGEDVLFWKWVSVDTLGLITDTAVFHWNVFDANQQAPIEIFKRNPNLNGCQIINYRLNEDDKWMVVVGIQQQGGRVVGAMQLYSRDRGISQAIEGHAAAFGTVHLEGAPADTRVFTFAVRAATGAKLHVVEIDHQQGNPVFTKKAVDVYFPPEATNDFPVSMQVSQKYSIIYLVTKYGFIHLYDLETGTCLFMNRISSETIFTTCSDSDSAGIVGINRKGQVLTVAVDENNIIPYLLQNPANSSLAVKLASRAGLAGADDLYQQQFEQLCAQGNWTEASKVAANSPRGFLRTLSTIERFKNAPPQAGGLSIVLQYFGMLLDKGGLNAYETVELVRPVMAQNRKHLLEKWLGENKLECSEELGDIVRQYDLQLALQVYLRANIPQKVIAAYAETGQFDKILPYAQQTGYQAEYTALLQHIIRVNPERGAEFAGSLANSEGGPLIDIDRVVDVFQSQNMIQQATAFLLDALKENKPEQGHLQTRLLEMNLINAPQVADAILGNEMFSYFDKPRISQLCEQAQLYQRALENTEDPAVIKRNIVMSDKFNPEWLISFFGRLSLEQSLDTMNEMLKVNIRQNLQAVVQIATKYSDLLGPVRLIELFERYRTAEGLYYYLGSIVNLSEDPDVNFKYIEAATKMNQLTEVQRICRDSNFYNAEKVKNFLKEARLSDQLPLIIVCDRFNFIHDLVLYLYQNQQFKSIEVYVQQVNPGRTPEVIGGLLDVDCDEPIIKNLLQSVNPASVPIDSLVSEVESRNRLKLLLPFLEATLASGNQQQAVFNALAKIYIDSNNNPEKFLKENDMYDTLTVGKYCEKRDPNLAFTAYRKGQNDLELINITNENSMYKQQARYLLERADPEIWAFVLKDNNIHRRQLIDQVTSTAVPESTEPEQVSVAVKAFLEADLPSELIDLLEKIIIEPSPFSDNGNLQNLLMFTAAKADKGRMSDYIDQLDAYDADEIANTCISVGMFEEAFKIYKKENNHGKAMDVLVDHVVSIDRAQEYAERVDLPEVWSKTAKAQLDGVRVTDAVDSYIKAQDPSNYAEVIETATHAGKDDDLIRYLRMARKTEREPAIDTALAFSFARTNQLAELEDFLHAPNQHLQLGQAGHHARAPRRPPGGRRVRAQGQQRQGVEAGQRGVRGAEGVPPRADLRPAPDRARRGAGGPGQAVRAERLLRRADRAARGRAGPGARAHGHVHRAGHPAVALSPGARHGAPQALLVAHQHPQDDPGLRGRGAVARAHLPLLPLRRVGQRGAGHDGARRRRVGAPQLQGHRGQGGQPRDLLPRAQLLPDGAAVAADGHPAGADAARRREPRGQDVRQVGQHSLDQAVPALGAGAEQARRQRRHPRPADRGGGPQDAARLGRAARQLRPRRLGPAPRAPRPRLLPPGRGQHLPPHQALGQEHRPVQAGQAVQGRHRDGRHLGQDRGRRGFDPLLRRHRQPRVLRRHAVRLLRPAAAGPGARAVLAPRPARLHHALPHQHYAPAELDHRDAHQGQRGAQGPRGQPAEEGGRHAHPGRQPPDADTGARRWGWWPAAADAGAHEHRHAARLPPDERHHAAADGVSRVLMVGG